jgi:hypothetical protein
MLSASWLSGSLRRVAQFVLCTRHMHSFIATIHHHCSYIRFHCSYAFTAHHRHSVHSNVLELDNALCLRSGVMLTPISVTQCTSGGYLWLLSMVYAIGPSCSVVLQLLHSFIHCDSVICCICPGPWAARLVLCLCVIDVQCAIPV